MIMPKGARELITNATTENGPECLGAQERCVFPGHVVKSGVSGRNAFLGSRVNQHAGSLTSSVSRAFVTTSFFNGASLNLTA